MTTDVPDPAQHLIERSRRLGADPTVTNYGGGNTSAKGTLPDQIDGTATPVLWVKGSGGDLGTLTADGLSTLRLDRIRALDGTYRGEDDEDRMHELLDVCAFCDGPAPSIDTTMHALLAPAHVDHTHPDDVIALATAADGPALVERCFGGRIAWVDWRRPGFELAKQVAALQRDRPELEGVVLGGHGLTTWGEDSATCEERTRRVIAEAGSFIVEHGRAEPFGAERPGYAGLPTAQRLARLRALAPLVRGLVSTDRSVVAHLDDRPELLAFLASEAAPRLVPLGTSCPDHLIRTRTRPLLLDLPADAPLDDQRDRLRELHAAYRDDYAAYYAAHAGPDDPPMRGADPTVVLLPGIGMLSFGVSAQEARITGEYYINAVNAMRGAEALSSYQPIPDEQKFRIEYWKLEEAKLQRRPAPRPLTGKVALVTGGGSGIGRACARELADHGAAVVIVDREADAAGAVADELGADRAHGVTADLRNEQQVIEAIERAVVRYGGIDVVVNSAGLSLSSPLLETSVDEWDLQHEVMARGSFLVSREAARVMIDQGRGGDIVMIASKNAVVAGPQNVAYGAAKADQLHQTRLLATELAPHRIRVNAVNPDGIVRDSGIFAGDWGAQRAAVHGVEPAELGAHYAARTLLGEEVLPEHVAGAVGVLVGQLPRTTGHVIPVDGGLPAAFLR